MVLPVRAFGGATFLPDVRRAMDSGGGLYAARDGALRYVFLDADLFHLKLLRRRADQTFTVAALAARAVDGARVAANAQVFPSYCIPLGDCPPKWRGQAVTGGRVVPIGDPPATPAFRYFGQTEGYSEGSFVVGPGDPAAAPTPILEGVGRLLPMVAGRAVAATPGTSGTFWTKPVTTGKIVYGVARVINAVMVLAQQDGETGLNVASLAALLVAAGIDDAAMGDGSNSATLLVDGVVEVVPGSLFKNRAIPTGLAFVPHRLVVGPTARLENTPGSTHPDFQAAFDGSGLAGDVSAAGAELRMELTSLGRRSDTNADLLAALGAPGRLVLRSSGARFANPVVFTDGVGIELVGTLVRTPATAGVLTGTLKTSLPGGTVVLDVFLPLLV